MLRSRDCAQLWKWPPTWSFVGLAGLEPANSALSVLLAPPFGAAMPNEYSRSPAALLSATTPELASVGVILGAHGGAMGAQAAQSPVVGISIGSHAAR